MSTGLVLACAALGAGVGALTPWLSYRLAVEQDAPARSSCHRCGHVLGTGVAGWLRVTTRCPDCGARLGPPVGLAALAGAAGLAALGWALGPVVVLPAFLYVFAVGVLLAFVDLACLRLPDPLVLLAFVGGAGWLAVVAVVDGRFGDLGRSALAALASAAAYLVLALLPGASLGFGDVKLAGVLGFLLGWLGWPAVLLGLVLPHLINGPVALVQLLRGRAGRKSDLPLGPALLAGALSAVVLAVRVTP